MSKTRGVTAIDLGNNGTRAGKFVGGDSGIIPASNGRPYIITAIAKRGDRFVVGEDAEALVREDPTCGVVGLKQLLKAGTEAVEIAGETIAVPALVGKFIELAFPSLAELSQHAPVVVSYPTGSPESVRRATIEAVRQSGCHMMTVPGGTKPLTVDEATALAIAAIQESELRLKDGDTIYVGDFGHVTGDKTILRASRQGRRLQIVLSPLFWDGSARLGGLTVDDGIAALVGKAKRIPAEATPQAIRMAARLVKTLLSDPTQDSARFLLAGFDSTGSASRWEHVVTRADLAKVLKGFQREMTALVKSVLKSAGTPNVTHVIVGGGLANLPEVSGFLKAATGCESIHVVRYPELATVKGAALFGAQCHGISPGGVLVNSVIRRDVLLMVDETDVLTALPRGTAVPSKPMVVEIRDREVRRLMLAEAADPGAINTTRRPTFFNLPDGHRFVRIQADLTGVEVGTSHRQGGPWKSVEVDWPSHRTVDQFLENLGRVTAALAQ